MNEFTSSVMVYSTRGKVDEVKLIGEGHVSTISIEKMADSIFALGKSL